MDENKEGLVTGSTEDATVVPKLGTTQDFMDGAPTTSVDTENSDNSENPDDLVNHPPHYNTGKIEVIDVIEGWGLDFCLGNTVKYIARAKHKGKEIEDLKKAKWYLDKEVEILENRLSMSPRPIWLLPPQKNTYELFSVLYDWQLEANLASVLSVIYDLIHYPPNRRNSFKNIYKELLDKASNYLCAYIDKLEEEVKEPPIDSTGPSKEEELKNENKKEEENQQEN